MPHLTGNPAIERYRKTLRRLENYPTALIRHPVEECRGARPERLGGQAGRDRDCP